MRTLNTYLQVENSPISTIKRMSPLVSQDTIDFQASRLKITNMAFPTIINRAIEYGTFGVDGSSNYIFHSTIRFKKPHERDMTFAQIHFSAWRGTSLSTDASDLNLIFPDEGANHDGSQTNMWAWYDGSRSTRTNYDGTNSSWSWHFTSQEAGSIIFVTDWKFLQFFNSGIS